MDEERFREIYAASAGVVFTFARRRLSAIDAEDLVADVFLVAWRRRDELPADPLGWLLGVARRTLANRRRSQARSEALLNRLTRETIASADPNVSPDLDVDILRALGSLQDDDRDLLELLAWDGLSRDQLAAVFGVSRGALAVRIYRARRKLAAALDDQSRTDGSDQAGASRLKEAGHA